MRRIKFTNGSVITFLGTIDVSKLKGRPMSDFIANQIVVVTKTVNNPKEDSTCVVRVEVHYGRIVCVDSNKEYPFLVEIISESGVELLQWFKSHSLFAIR